MPIVKVPVVHKFGIISQSHRLDLQRRILQQNQPRPTPDKTHFQRNVLEVSEEFISEYNNAGTRAEKLRVENKGNALLERIKRKVGLKDGCTGKHVDLPGAWADLSLLAQCKGRQLQEECLHLLINSLDQGPLDSNQIVVLFYLAETALYWVRTESVYQQYLSSFELQLLAMARLVFMRLYFHHMAGQLGSFQELKDKLFNYLDGFEDVQEVYSPYPNALFCVRYIHDVGQLVTGGWSTTANQYTDGPSTTASCQSLSMTVHELTPSLWHALDVWRCSIQLSGGLESALESLANCSGQIALDNWIDSVCALEVLADAAKVNFHVLSIVENIARGICNTLAPSGRTTAESSGGRASHIALEHDLEDARNSVLSHLENNPSTASEENRSEIPLTQSEVKMDVEPSVSRMSVTSSRLSYTNVIRPELSGLHGWRWEIGVAYLNNLTDICMHGVTSAIQKQALLGQHQNPAVVHKTASTAQNPMFSAGLLDLVYFHACNEINDGGPNDWSWRLRYVALQSLVTICRSVEKDPLKDGQSVVSWNALERARALETDLRVLEAVKTLPTDSTMATLLNAHSSARVSTIGARVAEALSRLYLPPLPPVVAPLHINIRAPLVHVDHSSRAHFLKTHDKSTRVTTSVCRLSSASNQPPSFEARTTRQLQDIVAEQWQKELERTEQEEKVL